MRALDWRGIILSQGCMVSDQNSYLPICDLTKAALVCNGNGIVAIILPWSPKFNGGNANHLKTYFDIWYKVAKTRHTRCWDSNGVTIVVEATRRYHSLNNLIVLILSRILFRTLKALINFEHLPPGSGGALKCFLHLGRTYRHHTEFHTKYGNWLCCCSTIKVVVETFCLVNINMPPPCARHIQYI